MNPRSKALHDELARLETRRDDLARAAEETAPAPITIHPNVAELYRRKVEALHEALADDEMRSQAAEALRGLIECVRVTPEADGGHTVEIVGELAALMRAGGANDESAAILGDAARSRLLVAGGGF